jgi:hypothetical protein
MSDYGTVCEELDLALKYIEELEAQLPLGAQTRPAGLPPANEPPPVEQV